MEREEATAMARATLKKVLSGKGRLQGNFYFVADSGAKEVVLIATLASRDKKGTRAVNQGKPFRKEIKGAKFARGSITFKDGKMVFTVHKGNANKKSMTDGFRKVLAKEKGLGFLKRAVITTASATEEERLADEAEGSAVDEAELAEAAEGISETELAVLAEEQGDLESLSAFFTQDDEALEAAYAEEVGEALGALRQLLADEGADPDAVADARADLAELLSVGKDNLPQLGEDLPEELMAVITSAQELLGDEDDEDDESDGERLLSALQQAERRYYAAGQPEDVAEWLVKIQGMHDDEDYAAGLKALADEVEWRLVRSERVVEAETEIASAGEHRRELAQARILWEQAHSAAAQELEQAITAVVSHPSVKGAEQFSQIQSGLNNIKTQIPDKDAVVDAIDEIVNATPDQHARLRDAALKALDAYANELAQQELLERIDDTVFGTASVYSRLEDAVDDLRDILSSISDA